MHIRCCAIALAVALARLPIAAQTPRDSVRVWNGFCLRGRPAPQCNRFLLFELGAFAPVVSSKQTLAFAGGETNVAYRWHAAWELGAMRNVGVRSAVGITGAAGFSPISARFAIAPRYRWWLSDNASVEASAGPLWTHMGDAFESSGVGATETVRFNFRDQVALSVRADEMRTTRFGSGHAIYAGISLGSKPAVVGTGVAAGLAVLGVIAAVFALGVSGG